MEKPKIIVHVGTQRDGYTFRLNPLSQLWLEEQWPEKDHVASVFIGFDKRQNIQQIRESIWNQVSALLTGFSLEELNPLGGFVVVDPLTNQEVYNSLLVHV